MLPVYVASLLVGLGVLVVQLTVGHDTAGGHDVHHGDGTHELTPFTIVASVRFWAFALLAFGLVGTLLVGFGIAGRRRRARGRRGGRPGVGRVRRHRREPPAEPEPAEHVVVRRRPRAGGAGRRPDHAAEGRGKVRVEVKGTAVDLIARARESLETGAPVVVEEVTSEGEAQVSRAPKELAP